MNFLRYLNWKYGGQIFRVAGVDMGTVNTSVTIVDISYNKEPLLVFSDIIPHPVSNMGKTLPQQTHVLRRYFNTVLDLYKPNVIVPELFMQRKFRSNLASPISYMIGLMTEIARQHNIQTKTTMPSQWKRALEKQITRVDNLYDLTYPVKQRLPNHPIDALCLAIFRSPNSFKSVNKCQLLKLRDQIKGSTSIQAWLEQEIIKKKTPKKKRKVIKKTKKKK